MENKLSFVVEGFENLAEIIEIDNISNEERMKRMQEFVSKKLPPEDFRIKDVMSEEEYRKLMNGEEHKVFLMSFKYVK